jgi:molecular chaperone DnaJ
VDGHLLIRIKVEKDTTLKRDGMNIISKHYVTLTEALLGCNVTVNTVNGPHTIDIKGLEKSGHRHVLHGKGING